MEYVPGLYNLIDHLYNLNKKAAPANQSGSVKYVYLSLIQDLYHPNGVIF